MKQELTLAQKLFKRVIKKAKVQKELEAKKAQIEAHAKNDPLLAQYLDVLAQLNEQQDIIKQELEPLREAMEAEGLPNLENDVCKVTVKKSYTKTVIDAKKFYEFFKPTSKTYQKVVVEQPVKGSCKLEIKPERK